MSLCAWQARECAVHSTFLNIWQTQESVVHKHVPKFLQAQDSSSVHITILGAWETRQCLTEHTCLLFFKVIFSFLQLISVRFSTKKLAFLVFYHCMYLYTIFLVWVGYVKYLQHPTYKRSFSESFINKPGVQCYLQQLICKLNPSLISKL